MGMTSVFHKTAILETHNYFIPIDFHLLSRVGNLPLWWFCNAKD